MSSKLLGFSDDHWAHAAQTKFFSNLMAIEQMDSTELPGSMPWPLQCTNELKIETARPHGLDAPTNFWFQVWCEFPICECFALSLKLERQSHTGSHWLFWETWWNIDHFWKQLRKRCDEPRKRDIERASKIVEKGVVNTCSTMKTWCFGEALDTLMNCRCSRKTWASKKTMHDWWHKKFLNFAVN